MPAMLQEIDFTGRALHRPPVPGHRARVGGLEVRLADTLWEIDAAQALRYRVFHEEMGAAPSPAMEGQKRDFDVYDGVADHLLAGDPKRGPGAARVVGTYRLIRGRKARAPARICRRPAFAPAPSSISSRCFNGRAKSLS